MEYTDEVKAELAEKGAQKVFTVGDIRLYTCPLSFISSDTIDLIRISALVDCTGHLLHPGGLGDQPAWLIEGLEIYRIERAKWQQPES